MRRRGGQRGGLRDDGGGAGVREDAVPIVLVERVDRVHRVVLGWVDHPHEVVAGCTVHPLVRGT